MRKSFTFKSLRVCMNRCSCLEVLDPLKAVMIEWPVTATFVFAFVFESWKRGWMGIDLACRLEGKEAL